MKLNTKSFNTMVYNMKYNTNTSKRDFILDIMRTDFGKERRAKILRFLRIFKTLPVNSKHQIILDKDTDLKYLMKKKKIKQNFKTKTYPMYLRCRTTETTISLV